LDGLSHARLNDVVVIGGGPAGAVTARHLAASGADVALIEEHEVVGSPVHCTGLLGFEAFDEFDLPPSLVLATARTARFWGAAGRSVAIGSNRVTAAVIDRLALDELLVARAKGAGVAIHTGCRAEHIEVTPEKVRVTVRGAHTPFEARACVLACGANYRFHRALGLGLPRVFLQSHQVETPFPSMPEVEVRLGRDVAPGGFAWMVPLNREGVPHARIGAMTTAKGPASFATFLESLCTRAGVEPATIRHARPKMLPLGPVRRTYADRVLAVGDAAGLVKPTTGGGIYYGMLSGTLAAEVLEQGLQKDRLSAAHLSRYETRWRQRFGQEIRVGLAFRHIASRLSDDLIDELIDLARLDGVVPLLQETASFNWHRKAAVALLGHPGVRRIMFKSWVRSADLV
jgi:digeranylgeranylglycerophospholipid reductase